MTSYRITEYCTADGTGVRRSGWGVALFRDGICIRAVDDLSPDRDAVSRLVALFNEEDLDPVHFDQAIEDFLLDLTV